MRARDQPLGGFSDGRGHTRRPERASPERDLSIGLRAADLYFLVDYSKGMAKVSSKNQITLPVEAMRAAGLRPGDEVTVRPVGEGEVLVAARGSRVRRHAGIATGIYAPGELDRLRNEWER